MSKSKDSDHIEDMLEWQNKQYTPWEYAQDGKLPLPLKAEGSPKLAAILFFIQGGICTLILVLLMSNISDLSQEWMELLITAVYGVICFMAAVNYLRKGKARKQLIKKPHIHRKKRKH